MEVKFGRAGLGSRVRRIVSADNKKIASEDFIPKSITLLKSLKIKANPNTSPNLKTTSEWAKSLFRGIG